MAFKSFNEIARGSLGARRLVQVEAVVDDYEEGGIPVPADAVSFVSIEALTASTAVDTAAGEALVTAVDGDHLLIFADSDGDLAELADESTAAEDYVVTLTVVGY